MSIAYSVSIQRAQYTFAPAVMGPVLQKLHRENITGKTVDCIYCTARRIWVPRLKYLYRQRLRKRSQVYTYTILRYKCPLFVLNRHSCSQDILSVFLSLLQLRLNRNKMYLDDMVYKALQLNKSPSWIVSTF